MYDKMANIISNRSDTRGIEKALDIDEVIITTTTQSRTEIKESVVDDYAEDMLKGDVFPPLIIFYDKVKKINLLADGFHRYYAMRKIEKTGNIAVTVYGGDERKAILYSLQANAQHGLRRTNEDKRKAVLTLLQDEEWAKYSARHIANIVGVSNNTVSNIKKELGLSGGVITSDGREYKPNKQRLNIAEQRANMTKPQDENIENTENIKGTYARKKYFRIKLDLKYKDILDNLLEVSGYRVESLMREAFALLEEKYLDKK